VSAVLVTGMQNSPFSSPVVTGHHKYSLCLPTEGWPGWVALNGWIKY